MLKILGILLATGSILLGDEVAKTPDVVLVHVGLLTLKPSAFFEAIGMSRSSPTADSISTGFGRIPFTDGPEESLGSIRHSRLMLKGDLPAGSILFSAYLESDFMTFTPNHSPYRWRQYWGQAKWGKWELLGGQAWSLLRPNRLGTSSDKDMMNTDVIEPAYHVGLIGSRVRQARLSRQMGIYKAAVAWEADGNLVTKIVRDTKRKHLELGGFTGRFGRRGVTASAVLSVSSRIRLITQQYWSKRAAYQAMGVVPLGVNGVSTLEGIEAQIRKNLEVYGYGGLVYASRANLAGNRLVREWSVGVNQKIGVPWRWGGLLVSLQYSHIDRAIWAGREGILDYWMYRMRYVFN